LVLREIEEMDYRDIATVTDVPIGTVMSRLARARAALKARWLQEVSGEPHAVR
jgi:RNA polymerase sigma-70 factor (ECF subfamily)